MQQAPFGVQQIRACFCSYALALSGEFVLPIWKFLALSILTVIPLTCNLTIHAQTTKPAPDASVHKFTGKIFELRIRRQRAHVQQGLTDGNLKKSEADSVNSKLDDIEAEIKKDRDQNGGVLRPNEVSALANRLAETRDFLQSKAPANKKIDDGPNVLGARWVQGRDGGENTKKLQAEMKQEERRELRQERQNHDEVLEQQQLQYEQEAMESLDQNRAGIVNQKGNLEVVRKKGGN